jgi:hypothetical protein
MVTSVTKDRTVKLPPKIPDCRNILTIHWKACEQHFLMVPLVFLFPHFRGKMGHFLNFSQKTSILNHLFFKFRNVYVISLSNRLGSRHEVLYPSHTNHGLPEHTHRMCAGRKTESVRVSVAALASQGPIS